MEDKYYIHSRCCNSHWELICYPKEKRMELVCMKCDKTAGIEAHYRLPGEKCKCEYCKEDKNENIL